MRAGVNRNPIFDVSAAAGSEGAEAGQQSRVSSSRKGPQPGAPQFLRLLRAGAEDGDFTSFAGHLRDLAPAAVDRELRAMQVSALLFMIKPHHLLFARSCPGCSQFARRYSWVLPGAALLVSLFLHS